MWKHRVYLTASDRGWPEEDYWWEDYDTRAQAEARIQQVNSYKGPGPGGQWYMYARDEIEYVDVRIIL